MATSNSSVRLQQQPSSQPLQTTPGMNRQQFKPQQLPVKAPHSRLSQESSSSSTTVDSLPSSYVTCSSAAAAPASTAAGFGPPPTQQGQRRVSTAAGPASTQQQQDAADAALYRDMRQALAEFEAQVQQLAASQSHARTLAAAGQLAVQQDKSSRNSCRQDNSKASTRPARMPPRQHAFYAALRSVLQQVLAETTPVGRHTRLLAAHAWYVGHRPRPAPPAGDPGLAAALAASLSVSASTGVQQGQQGHGGFAAAGAAAAAGGQHRHGSAHKTNAANTAAAAAGGDCDSDSSGCSEPDAGAEWIHQRQQQQQQQLFPAHEGSSNAEAQQSVPKVGLHGPPATAAAAVAAQQVVQPEPLPLPEGVGVGGQSSGCSRRGAGERNLQKPPGGIDAAAEVPGLIPVGCLPSGRFADTLHAAAAAEAAAFAAGDAVAFGGAVQEGGGIRLSQQHQQQHNQQQQQNPQQQQQQQAVQASKAAWGVVVAQQAALEAQVAGSMRSFARQQARLEEDICRRQELAAVAAVTAAARQHQQQQQQQQRLLQHVDSQHQPSAVSAPLALTATGLAAGIPGGPLFLPGCGAAGAATAAGGSAIAAAAAAAGFQQQGCCGGSTAPAQVALLRPDRVKAARSQHLQEGMQEVSVLQQQLGLPGEVLARALLPAVDMPYMSAFFKLPRYQPAVGAGLGGKKKGSRKGSSKAKGKKKNKKKDKEEKKVVEGGSRGKAADGKAAAV